MSNETLLTLIGVVIGFGIWTWIVYEIIYAASYGRKIWIESKKQSEYSIRMVRLLAELLERQGISKERINEIVDLEKNYFQQ